MGNNLHHLLKSLCFNTHWNYAIFWKRKHGAQMILTLEDAYYDILQCFGALENKYCQKTFEQIGGEKISHDAVAKMAYHTYSLGEGIVGQVAVTGKHLWICADNQVTSSGLSYEFADEWQSQFSAGIRTIVVVPVVPLGVVQLGSRIKVNEDIGVVNHIRNLFLSTQDYSTDHIPTQIQSSLMPPCLHDTEKTMRNETVDVLMQFQCSGRNNTTHSAQWKIGDNMVKHEGPEIYSDVGPILFQSMSDMINVENQEGESSVCKNMRLESEQNLSSFFKNSAINNVGVSDLIHESQNTRVDSAWFPTVSVDAYVCESDKLHYLDTHQKEMSNISKPLDANNSHKHTKKLEFQTAPCDTDTLYFQTERLKFPAGCELHEALGPASSKAYFDCSAQVNEDMKMVDIPNTIYTSQLTCDSPPDHLLEAMVANICHSSNNDVNSELSFSRSMQSAMSSGKTPEGIMSSKGVSSTCPSVCSEQLERSSEPSKNSKKRARPGESCRPRPRDRQLIQDRIKELRELVPNGAKCSIDSLLERSIKHMLFLQSITKHADKLPKFANTKSKLYHMETDILESSSSEQGSSWAVEVGGHMKVHSILVENLSNGQMLVEMLCEECSHFLEISEAIRSLGLTILKGATKTRDEKICICFIVEGENNRNLHRLDILWPLVQILQSKSVAYQ